MRLLSAFLWRISKKMSGTINKESAARASKVTAALKREYPDARCALNYETPFQLLIATILSAQCTDARVNIVTSTLFNKYRTPSDFIAVPDEELEKDIFSTGFYKQKAKSIKACCIALIEKHGGDVPSGFDDLCELPGVGRKTASVVAGNAFGFPSVAVDTHVKRITNLLGLVESQDPEKIEAEIKLLVDPNDWVIFSHLIATHGRTVCFARKPACSQCVISGYCPSVKYEK